MDEVTPNANGTYDAEIHKTHIGTFASKAQALAAIHGVRNWLKVNPAAKKQEAASIQRGIRQISNKFYVTSPARAKGSFNTLAEAQAHRLAFEATLKRKRT